MGSVPTGLWLGHLVAGVDVRTVGSRRTGATNVMRSLGAPAALTVLALDVLKGLVPVLVARGLTGSDYLAAAAGIGAVIGHVWPVLAGFRGGRGVATGAGALVMFAPVPVFCAIAVMAVVVAITRYVSLGSIVAGLTVVVWAAAWRGHIPQSDAGLVAALLVGLLVVFVHADNLKRILNGTESRLGG